MDTKRQLYNTTYFQIHLLWKKCADYDIIKAENFKIRKGWEFMEEQNFLVKGSVILEWWSKKPKIKLYWSDFDDNKFYVKKEEIEIQKYYEFDLEDGEVELTLFDFVETLEELVDWL